MAATQVSNPSLTHPAQESGPQQKDAGAVTALVPSQQNKKEEPGLDLNGPLARLPVELDVGVPIRDFRVRDLLALQHGVVVASQWLHADDLPVLSGKQALAWSEFEVVDFHLAVRITRLP
jgi:flagellar motor switch/type III secretory pathway protein FliN